jgi:hypothetical protein
MKTIGVFTLNINNFAPEIVKLTKPFMEAWCRKIGADFIEITERKFPDMPPNYEKFQIYELGQKYDWQIFIDADALVALDFFNPTLLIEENEMLFYWCDMANTRFKYDIPFLRDKRNIGAGTWFVVTNRLTLDAWMPLHLQNDITYEECLKNIIPDQSERNFGIDAAHLIDDYIVSRNIAKFGIKVKTLKGDIYENFNVSKTMLQHTYLDTIENKLKLLKQVVFELSQLNRSRFDDKGEFIK